MNLQSGKGMYYDGMLSFNLQPVAALPPPNLLAAINDANELLLANVLMLEEKHEPDDHDEVMQELKRQDTKLRLIMELLGTLLLQNQLLPPPGRIRFSGEELSVPALGDAVITPGHMVQLSLYVEPGMPKPLILFAESNGAVIHEDGDASDSGAHWQLFAFTGMNEPVQDSLEKLIFRQHRKLVAQQRRIKGSE